MARTFDGSDDQGIIGSTPLTGVPLAICTWFIAADNLAQTLISLNDPASTLTRNHLSLTVRRQSGVDRVAADAASGVGSSGAVTSTDYSGSWAHGAAIFAADDDRRALLNNGGKGTSTTSRVPSGIAGISVGAMVQATSGTFLSGSLAEGGVWDLSVWPGSTNAQKADNFEALALPALAAGYSPACFPLGLRAYWRFLGNSSPEPDHVGGFNLTLTGTTKAEHPRIIVPHRAKLIVPVAAVGGGANSGSGTINAVGELSGTGHVVLSGSGAIEAVGELSGVGYAVASGSGAIDAIGQLSGVGYSVASGSGVIEAVGQLSGDGFAPFLEATGSGAISAIGQLGGTGHAVYSGSGAIEAVGGITGDGYAVHSGSGAIQAVGQISGDGFAPAVAAPSGSGKIDAVGQLSGDGYSLYFGSGSVEAIGQLSGTGYVVTSGAGVIEAVGMLTGDGIGLSNVVAGLQFVAANDKLDFVAPETVPDYSSGEN